MTPAQFWQTTPRKLVLLLHQHVRYQKALWGGKEEKTLESTNESDDDYNRKCMMEMLKVKD